MTSSPFVIGLVGCKNVGKTTVARMIKKKWNFPEYTFAEPIKEICKIAFLLDDWQVNDQTGKETLDARWNTTPRKLLQTVGTNLFRDCY
jgi:uridine kinase